MRKTLLMIPLGGLIVLTAGAVSGCRERGYTYYYDQPGYVYGSPRYYDYGDYGYDYGYWPGYWYGPRYYGHEGHERGEHHEHGEFRGEHERDGGGHNFHGDSFHGGDSHMGRGHGGHH